jgi:hypothetical protein
MALHALDQLDHWNADVRGRWWAGPATNRWGAPDNTAQTNRQA